MAVYDYYGNIISLDVSTDKTLKNADVAADSKTVGDIITKSDIPCLYITGGALPVSKDDGKVKFAIQYISNTETFSEYCTLKPQGDSSLAYPKKNFNIVFYKDATFNKKSKHNFKNWGDQSKYTLKANWVDVTHARNIVTANIWTDMVKERTDYNALPEEMLASPCLGVIDGFPVRVFWNGVYQGRYTLNIPKDPWMYNMDDELETNVVLYAEGRATTNTATTFKEEVKIDGTDWSDEIHEDGVPQSVVDRFNSFIRFVINSTDTEFVNGIQDYANLESLIDVYIMALVSCGTDSLYKNQILLSYDGVVYYGSMYDLDSTWGMRPGGLIETPYDLPITNVYFTGNRLFDRIRTLFPTSVKKRFASLRTGALSENNIAKRFSEFSKHITRELIEQDWAETTANGAYIDIPSKEESTIPNILVFATKRLEYLDEALKNEYPKIVATYNSGANIVFVQDGIDSLKQYLTVKYYESQSDPGITLTQNDYKLFGNLLEGNVQIDVRYNGYFDSFDANIIDFYNQMSLTYPGRDMSLQAGNVSRASVYGNTHMVLVPSSGKYVCTSQIGVRPFISSSTKQDIDAYPLPLPDGVNKITVSVFPSNISIKMSLWQYYGGSGRYVRTQESGILGTGTVTWSDITRQEDAKEYLCVELTKSDGSISEGEITSYTISYEVIS